MRGRKWSKIVHDVVDSEEWPMNGGSMKKPHYYLELCGRWEFLGDGDSNFWRKGFAGQEILDDRMNRSNNFGGML